MFTVHYKDDLCQKSDLAFAYTLHYTVDLGKKSNKNDLDLAFIHTVL